MQEPITMPAEPEKVPCLLISGNFNSGLSFDYSIREDLGDTFTDTGTYLILKNGKTGQQIELARSEICVLSTVTVQVAKELRRHLSTTSKSATYPKPSTDDKVYTWLVDTHFLDERIRAD